MAAISTSTTKQLMYKQRYERGGLIIKKYIKGQAYLFAFYRKYDTET
jgi:hypothetical protein